MTNNRDERIMRKAFAGLLFTAIAFIPQASASSIAQPTEFDVVYLYPLLSLLSSQDCSGNSSFQDNFLPCR